MITLTDESTGLLLEKNDDNKIKLQIKKLDPKQRWKKEDDVDGTYFYLITYEDATNVLTLKPDNNLEIKKKDNSDRKFLNIDKNIKL